MLPAASSADTVIVLSPFCSGIVGIDHWTLSVVPDKTALPLPPRSLTQRTAYKRLLSLAVPARLTCPFESAPSEPMDTIGAIESLLRQRRRSASAS
jgi:hypothetical protein